MRASSPEYDAWNEFGTGWDWQSLLPYFKAGETYEGYNRGTDEIFPGITTAEDEAARQNESKFRGHSGAVHSTHNTIYTDLLEPLIKTTLSYGIKTNRTPVCNLSNVLKGDSSDVGDQGYGDSTGMFNIDTSVNRKEGTRSYAANAYLRNPKSVVPRSNMVILKGIYATKILFDGDEGGKDRKAIGLACLRRVDWKSDHTSTSPIELRVNKEVIVSAGKLDGLLNALDI